MMGHVIRTCSANKTECWWTQTLRNLIFHEQVLTSNLWVGKDSVNARHWNTPRHWSTGLVSSLDPDWLRLGRGQSYLMGGTCLFSLGWPPWCHDKNVLRVMFYINQLHTPSFPIELVKTESGCICRSSETGYGRWTLLVAVISFDAYPFGFLRHDLSPWGCGNKCFLVTLCHLIVRRANLEVAIKMLLHQQVKVPR